MSPISISAAEALELLLRRPEAVKALDVRSPGEFAEGALPHFHNQPILNNEERRLVGTSYKREGQAAAVALGHQLVDPQRAQRAAAWADYLGGAEWPLVSCWRGGLRSQISCEWIRAAGGKAIQVQGGYKEIRRLLLAALEELPGLLVLSGATGSGKTGLLRSLSVPLLDIERHARHRGSAFGALPGAAQPAQATFENALGFSLRKGAAAKVVVEDESQVIGQVHLPAPLKQKILSSPVVIVEMSAEERAGNILAEYVLEPLRGGADPEALQGRYLESLEKIRKRLGGQLCQEVAGKVRAAFAAGEPDLHRAWIRDLLLHYYDGAYAYHLARAGRPVAFRGDWNECRAWIQNQFA